NWMTGATTANNIADVTAGVTVSNYAAPTITSATYDMSNGQLAITGTDFVSKSGATNDIVANLMTLTGEVGTYTLTDTANVEVTSSTSATLTLSATDQLNINGLLNKNGTTSSSATTYNLAGADGWNAGSPVNEADLTANAVTVSNVLTPTITSAAYDSDTGVVSVTGTNFFKKVGVTNDIDLSTLTFTGGTGNATYTLTTAADVEITSATSFSFTLSGADKTSVDALLDQIGTSSSGGSTYNLASAEDWLTGADTASNIADASNAVTVFVTPKVTSATYDASSGVLVVTGTNIQANGGGSDIDASLFTLTGEGGETYTLTNTSDVERTSETEFTLTLSATDMVAVNLILNKAGTSSTGSTTYNLAAADDWDTNVTAGDTSDTTSNAITVSNVPVPQITSSTYNASTGALVVTGTDLLGLNGVTNDIVANKFTITGEGGSGAAYTLTDTGNVEITSAAEFTLTLSATDKDAVNQIINNNGTTSTSNTTYNLAAAEDWAAGADADVTVVDATGNGIEASGVAIPTITSATYNTGTGVLSVTGTGLLKLDGANNDIDVTKLTITGKASGTHTLTSNNVEITNGTTFSVTLNSADKTAVNALLDKDGTASTDTVTYNLAAAEDWAQGFVAAVNVVDLNNNTITNTVYVAPSGGGGGATTPPPTDPIVITTDTSTTTTDTGSTETTSQTITNTGTSSGSAAIVQNTNNNGNLVTATLPAGTTISSTGPSTAQTTSDALTTLISAVEARKSTAETSLISGAQTFLNTLVSTTTLDVRTIIPTTTTATSMSEPIVITGSSATSGSSQAEAFVIDVRSLPSGSHLQLDNIEFASIVGSATVTGGAGSNYVVGDDANQFISLGADDDVLYGGGGDDYVGSAGGDDLIYGEDGNDELYGGEGNDSLYGGNGDDKFTASIGNDYMDGGDGYDTVTIDTNASDYSVKWNDNKAIVSLNADSTQYHTIVHAELLKYTNESVSIDFADYKPVISSVSYDAESGLLSFQGSNLQANANAKDIDASLLTIYGERANTYTLTDTPDVDLIDSNSFSLTLSETDKSALSLILNKTGMTSTGGITYKLVAAKGWNTNVISEDISDLTGNTITVSNVQTQPPTVEPPTVEPPTVEPPMVEPTTPTTVEEPPTISSASYDALSGQLVLTGTNFEENAGYDIDVSTLSLVGDNGQSYTLTDTLDVDITSATTAIINLSTTDKEAVNLIMNNNGLRSNNGSTYYIKANSGFLFADSFKVSDLTDNPVRVTNVTELLETDNTKDIVKDSNNNGNLVTALLPTNISITSDGPAMGQLGSIAVNTLINSIKSLGTSSENEFISAVQSYMNNLSDSTLDVRTIVPSTTLTTASSEAIVITGSSGSNQSETLVIDMRSMPADSKLQLENIGFASILGSVTVTGSGANFIVADEGEQFISLGSGDDTVYGGGGSDVINGAEGNDKLLGGNDNDTLNGGSGNNTLSGGKGTDTVIIDGNSDDFTTTTVYAKTVIESKNDTSDSNILINAEKVQFNDSLIELPDNDSLSWIATLYQQILGRQADLDGFQYWAGRSDQGFSFGDIALAFIFSNENLAQETVTSQTADEKIEMLYHHILSRTSDEQGKAFWINQYNNGMTLDAIASEFVQSNELTGQYVKANDWDFSFA
ncbi:MAG: DUF4214 domain-containing protein, partial [Gammaproteobacteria bacterium]|nr:DUF4214 domain-containing protein [Gammaproteobacteria bacterium]